MPMASLSSPSDDHQARASASRAAVIRSWPTDAATRIDVRRAGGLSGFCDFDGREVWETCDENSRFGGTFASMLYFCNVCRVRPESLDSIGIDSLRALLVTKSDIK